MSQAIPGYPRQEQCDYSLDNSMIIINNDLSVPQRPFLCEEAYPNEVSIHDLPYPPHPSYLEEC